MARHWGNSDHEPGGDPSWLGGKDRAPDSQSSSGWSSDFAPQGSNQPSSDFADQRAPSADPRAAEAESMAPRFGAHGQESDGAPPEQWHSEFASPGKGGGSDGGQGPRLSAAKVIGMLTSVVGLIIFAFFALGAGMDLWWVILVFGVPLISRIVRNLQRSQRR